jgi:hypothetical protein
MDKYTEALTSWANVWVSKKAKYDKKIKFIINSQSISNKNVSQNVKKQLTEQ